MSDVSDGRFCDICCARLVAQPQEAFFSARSTCHPDNAPCLAIAIRKVRALSGKLSEQAGWPPLGSDGKRVPIP